MAAGLEAGDRLPFYVKEVEEKGRGVFCRENIPSGAYLCEYKTARVYPSSWRRAAEAEYERNGEGSYILDAICVNPRTGESKRLSFDATRRLDQVMSSPV